MHASVNVGCQGKSGPGKIHEVILVFIYETFENLHNSILIIQTKATLKITGYKNTGQE